MDKNKVKLSKEKIIENIKKYNRINGEKVEFSVEEIKSLQHEKINQEISKRLVGKENALTNIKYKLNKVKNLDNDKPTIMVFKVYAVLEWWFINLIKKNRS